MESGIRWKKVFADNETSNTSVSLTNVIDHYVLSDFVQIISQVIFVRYLDKEQDLHETKIGQTIQQMYLDSEACGRKFLYQWDAH